MQYCCRIRALGSSKNLTLLLACTTQADRNYSKTPANLIHVAYKLQISFSFRSTRDAADLASLVSRCGSSSLTCPQQPASFSSAAAAAAAAATAAAATAAAAVAAAAAEQTAGGGGQGPAPIAGPPRSAIQAGRQAVPFHARGDGKKPNGATAKKKPRDSETTAKSK